MNVLSLFDGISCGQVALERAGIQVNKYFASEVDKYAIQITQKNYPDTIQLGDVTKWKNWDLPKIDLLIGGSPCQGFSFAGKQLNFSDPRSRLFFTYADILYKLRPEYFLLENVRMKQEHQDVISSILGVKPVLINSALVSAQNRQRLYWTNIPGVTQPEDRGIMLKDVVLDDVVFTAGFNRKEGMLAVRKKAYSLNASDWRGLNRNQSQTVCVVDRLYKGREARVYSEKVPTLRAGRHGLDVAKFSVCLHNLYGGVKETEHRTFTEKSPTIRTAAGGGHIPSLLLSDQALAYMDREVRDGRTHWDFQHHSDVRNPKSATVVANFFKGVPYNVLKDWKCIRKLDPIECERLQTLDDNYSEGISNTQRYKALGNGWTVDVIVHILKGLI